jgi:hypothetical protein
MLDTSSILLEIFSTIWFIIPIAILIAFLKSPYFKGKVGEVMVNTTNSIRLDKSIYTALKDVTIKMNNGTTTQIDHILVSKFGIFVIETKNMKGWIFGSKEQKQWTQSIYGKKHSFQNPLHQNYKHIKALEEILGNKSNVHSIVTFVGECEFKTNMPNNVFLGGKYINYIKSFKNPVFRVSEVNQIIRTLKNNSLEKGKSTNKAHVSSLKNNHNRSSSIYTKDPKITCKRCGSAMKERHNKKTGEEFLGCSSFPKCKNTEQV